ncbi:MAG: hypothetical protein HFE79_13660 [Ruminiclostridium sp.]|nr:hypothetical protein [Ruminiclostridium sp.]
MKNDKKSRTMLLNFNVYNDTKIDINGQYTVEIKGLSKSDKFNYVDIKTYIDRQSENRKDKLVYMYSSINKNVATNPIDLIFEFDAIFAVDTNTEIIDNKRRCIGVIGQVKYFKKEEKIGLEKSFYLVYEIPIDDMNFEKYTWIKLIEIIQNSSTYSNDKKIGIVVDSYASEILEYNNGKEILPQNVLPQNFKLLYATSDKSGDGFLNWAIRQCDLAANKLKNNS